MSEPYIGEIRMFGGNFAPNGWMFCEGQLLSISEYEALFNLIGTTYGGDGVQTFALPDLRGRLPIQQGQGNGLSNRVIGEQFGVEDVTLTVAQMPAHSHAVAANNAAEDVSPQNNVPASTASDAYVKFLSPVNAHPSAITFAGNSQPHNNIQPYVCVNFIISVYGEYPSQS